MTSTARRVWLFHGDSGRFTSGVFTDTTSAREWILLSYVDFQRRGRLPVTRLSAAVEIMDALDAGVGQLAG